MPDALTLARASELFADLLPERGPLRAVSRFAGGSVTGAYRIEFDHTDSAPVVLKIYETDTQWWAEKEAVALGFLDAHGIDISPRPLAFSRSAEPLDGRPCVVSSLRPGRAVADLDAELTNAQRYEIYRQLGQALRRLHAIPAAGYGYVTDRIRDPLPDNSAHMARQLERDISRFRHYAADTVLADKLSGYFTEHAATFADCSRPSYCHGDVHENNLLGELTEDGTGLLTGLLDPQNLHAADPLMDIVRLDAFSMRGDSTKIDGLLRGYGVHSSAGRPGEWPAAWRSRLRPYRIALTLELYNWFAMSGNNTHLPGLDRELRERIHRAAV